MKSLNTLIAAFALMGTVSFTASTVFAAEAETLETVTEFTDSRAAGVTVTPNGRILVSMHPLDAPKLKVMEVMANGTKQPFPTLDWADGPEKGKAGFASVIGIHSDSKGIVWILDMGSETSPTQIVAWDTVKNKLHKQLEISKSALLENSFPQDFALDEKRQKIYIADMSFGNFNGATKPAIIVVDLKTGYSRRILESTDTFMPPNQDLVIGGVLLSAKTGENSSKSLHFGLNPIALDEKGEWLYFGTLSGNTIYRLPASLLADEKISSEKLASRIEAFGPKNPSDGIVMAPGNGVLVTDLKNNAIGLTTKNNYQILVQDKQLSWPDSLAVSNGWVYITQDQLHQHPAFSSGLGNAKPPYRLMRFQYKL
ncbi:L-dopachrome tautomerase-related protein [Microbulbifer sp. GL-2]|uniref:L-dopachrome tautomerase-related protein n=1 Tax=Microbulbifer sp. GL-2 TaxID=2591606 RepID=UPI001164D27D|nr:L-dopachrome tautomerase-related protein [Microbulbifer sp. GL-2]BBM03003.1 periplasmic protein [Microbulbifer sp. GL-2]